MTEFLHVYGVWFGLAVNCGAGAMHVVLAEQARRKWKKVYLQLVEERCKELQAQLDIYRAQLTEDAKVALREAIAICTFEELPAKGRDSH